MKMILLLTGCAVGALHAGPHSSAHYSIVTDSMDSAGTRAAGDHYTNDASLGGITGLTSASAQEEGAADLAARAGYIGQLYEPAALSLAAPGAAIAENGTLPLHATITLDDDTATLLPPAEVAWSVRNGPLAGITTGGVASGTPVYQNTPAIARGDHAGFTAFLALTVLDAHRDNFGLYAADGLPDLWQVQHFGEQNADGAPGMDPDGDGQDNLSEFNACLVPTDPLSHLSISLANAPGGGHAVSFTPRFAECTYTLLASSDLSLWEPVNGTITDDGPLRTIADPQGTAARRFYKVEVHRGE